MRSIHGGALFADRRDAGRRLASRLAALHLDSPIVLALPRGGVPVAAEVAAELAAPLDVMLVRKLGAPGQPEFGLGAVADGSDPQVVLNDEALAIFDPPPGYVDAESRRQLEELERRRHAYMGDREPLDPHGRAVVLVDDGIATGSTVKVALTALRRAGAARIILAVPLAPAGVLRQLASLADDVVCLASPEPFVAVGRHYADFAQTTDAEVVSLLSAGRRTRVPAGGAAP